MLKRPSEQRLTLEERVAVVVAIAVAVGVHVALFAAGSGIGRLVHEEKKRERLMVIRQVREITPPPDVAVRVPDPRRVQVAPEPGPESKAGGAPPKPEVKVSERGALPPPPKAEVSPAMEQDLREAEPEESEAKPVEKKSTEVGDSSVSVVTDLPAASFTVTGPAEYRGTGTFWVRRGAQPGTYRVTFSPVEGYAMPPPQTKELAAKGQIVFVGKYRRSTEVVVNASDPAAQFTIYRPDGRALDLSRPGSAFFDDLPPGTYTAVFKDLPGRITPPPVTRTLKPDSNLVFSADYKVAPGSRSAADATAWAPRRPGARAGDGDGTGGGGRGRDQVAEGAQLDKRVQMIVTSYPKTRIENRHPPIAYPEVVIRKSNFQQGWCQVYLILWVNARGDVISVSVERPSAETRAPYEALIRAVEESVREWDYDKVSAEVHVDARFYVE